MTRPTVEEIEFHVFKRALERAIANGTRIDPREKDRWAQYVTTHGVREVNFQGFARSKYEGLEPVILDGTDPMAGYYMWSAALERALRWRPAQKPGGGQESPTRS